MYVVVKDEPKKDTAPSASCAAGGNMLDDSNKAVKDENDAADTSRQLKSTGDAQTREGATAQEEGGGAARGLAGMAAREIKHPDRLRPNVRRTMPGKDQRVTNGCVLAEAYGPAADDGLASGGAREEDDMCANEAFGAGLKGGSKGAGAAVTPSALKPLRKMLHRLVRRIHYTAFVCT